MDGLKGRIEMIGWVNEYVRNQYQSIQFEGKREQRLHRDKQSFDDLWEIWHRKRKNIEENITSGTYGLL